MHITIPKILKQRYPKFVKDIDTLIKQNIINYRFTGNTHLYLFSIKDETINCTITTSKTADNPVYARKIKKFIRDVNQKDLK